MQDLFDFEISDLTISRLLNYVAKFLIIIFAIQNISLGVAFGDLAGLRFDLSARLEIDGFFFLQPLVQDVEDSQANGVAILDKLHFVDRGELFGDLVGKQTDFFA